MPLKDLPMPFGVGIFYGNLMKKNSGGLIIGKQGIDKIPAMLTNGEYVINASATKKFLPLLEKINSGQIQSFASGGMVGKNPWSSAGSIQNLVKM